MIPLGHSISKTRITGLGPLFQLKPSPNAKNRPPQSFAQKLRSTGKSVKEKLELNTGKKNSYLFIIPGNTILETSNCWKTIYHLLELYGTMSETNKTIQRVSISTDTNDATKSSNTPVQQSRAIVESISQERTRLIIFFGVAKIHKTRLLATLSGLKLEADITSLHSSVTWRKKARPVSLECSLTGQDGRAMIVLLEGVWHQINKLLK